MLVTVMPSNEPVSASTKHSRQILRQIFQLTKKQAECFQNIFELKSRGTCVVNLVDQLDSERSIVQKNLKILMKKGLVNREAVTLADFKERCSHNKDLAPNKELKTTKGYLYIYSPITPEELFQKIDQRMANWKSEIQDYFKQLQQFQ